MLRRTLIAFITISLALCALFLTGSTAAHLGDLNGNSPDRFRIKIWDKNNGGTIVYDNQLAAPDGADPTTTIRAGSIVVDK